MLENAPQQSAMEGEWYWREAVIHETGYPSPSPESLPHPFNAANHQINVHRHSPPTRKTNYLSILYCQVPSTLCLCMLQLVEESIKTWGRLLVEEEQWQKVRGGVQGRLSPQRRLQSGGTQEGRAESVTEQTVRWEIFSPHMFRHGLFLRFPHKSSPSAVPKCCIL